MIEGAPNPTAAPVTARIKWLRAFGLPEKKLIAAKHRPRIPTNGKMTSISFDWTAVSVDSTLQYPRTGTKHNDRASAEKKATRESFIETSFRDWLRM